jgi:hypothetical protein
MTTLGFLCGQEFFQGHLCCRGAGVHLDLLGD